MMVETEIIFERWSANATAAGVEASRKEFDEILDGGLAIRLEWLETVLDREDWSSQPPDFLHDSTSGSDDNE